VIRHADARTDAAPCAAIYAPFVTDGVISFEVDPPDEAAMAARIQEVSATHPWLVTEQDGAVAGYAYADAHHTRAAYRWAADVAVYVDPARHRRGLGRGLYEALFALLARQRLRMVCAGVTLPNDASVGLHEALGFQPVGVYRSIGWKAGAWWDVGWWQRPLEAGGDEPPMEPTAPARLGGRP